MAVETTLGEDYAHLAKERIQLTEATRILSEAEIKASVSTLTQKGILTARDERLLEYLRELYVLSVHQTWRLLWGNSKKSKTAYNRMHQLAKFHLLQAVRSPFNEMRTWGLAPSRVYSLGQVGRWWLKHEVAEGFRFRYFKRNQVLHDLLVSELCLKMTEAVTGWQRRGWGLSWAGERSASHYGPNPNEAPLIAPDGLARLTHGGLDTPLSSFAFFIELDASRQGHGRYRSEWGRKVVGYDQVYSSQWANHPELSDLNAVFPPVLVITHGAHRIRNLAESIAQKRKQAVIYYLSLWEDLCQQPDPFTSPCWIVIPPDSKSPLGLEPKDRQVLLRLGAEPKGGR